MSTQLRPPASAVPTLTDVVGFDGAEPVPPPDAVDALTSVPAAPTAAVLPLRAMSALVAEPVARPAEADQHAALAAHRMPAAPGAPIDEDALVQRVLVDVQRQVDRMFEFRVREAIGPAFARLLEGFLQETRHDLELTLSDVVRRAVAQELARHRPR